MFKIVNVNKTDEDGKLILKWRNDETTRKMSFNNKIQLWNDFKYIFFNDYFNHYIKPIFIVMNNIKIAFIGFTENSKKKFNIGINLNPDYRGKKLSSKIIKKTIKYLKFNYKNINEIVAEIKEINIPSIRAFENSNFKYLKKIFKNNETILVYNFNMTYKINNTLIGENYPTYFIAELSSLRSSAWEIKRLRTKAIMRALSVLCVSHNSPGSTFWIPCQTWGSPKRLIQSTGKCLV